MKGHHLRRGMLPILMWGPLLLASAGASRAQPAGHVGVAPVARSFDELTNRLQPRTTIIVTDPAGNEVSGRFVELSGTSLRLLVRGQPRTFAQTDVALVKTRRHDPLWNGFLIGAAAGAVPAIYWRFADPNECRNSICMSDLLAGVAVGGSIGLGIDAALKAKVVVYRNSSKPSTSTAVTIAPVIAGHRRGIGLTVSF